PTPTPAPAPKPAEPAKPAAAAPTATTVPAAAPTAAPKPTVAPQPTVAPKPTVAAAAPKPAAKEVELTFSNWNDDTYGRFREEEKVKLFNQKYPNIKINLRLFRQNYHETLLTQLAGGVGADVFRIDIPYIYPFADQGTIPDISSRMRDKEHWYSSPDARRDIFDALLYRGKFYAIATAVDSNCLEVNYTLFDEAKVPHLATSYTDKNWDVGVVLEAAKKLTRREGGTPTQFGINATTSSWHLCPLIWAFGGKNLTDDLSALAWNEDPAIKAIQFMADLVNVHKVAPALAGGEAKTFDYPTGKLAIKWSYPSQLVYRANAKLPFDWDLAPEPPAVGVTPRTTTAFNAWTMNAKGKFPEEAWSYLAFLSGPIATRVDVELGWASPAFKSLAEAYYRRILAEYPKKNVKPGVEAFDHIKGWYDPHMQPGWAEAETKYINPALDEVMIGKTKAGDAVKAIKPQVDKLLKAGAEKLRG
ncbi:MAG: hypothetical protein HYY04_07045, partial [Chloroflexi bacterium]|nr:hypothetical protein [Chloroflexota bacterium]